MPQVELDHASLEAFREWKQLPPHLSGQGQTVCVIKQPLFPQFRFEWHPQAKKVYLVRLGQIDVIDGEVVFTPIPTSQKLRAERIAEHVRSEGEAFNYVQSFLRGYREGRTPNLVKHHLEG